MIIPLIFHARYGIKCNIDLLYLCNNKMSALIPLVEYLFSTFWLNSGIQMDFLIYSLPPHLSSVTLHGMIFDVLIHKQLNVCSHFMVLWYFPVDKVQGHVDSPGIK